MTQMGRPITLDMVTPRSFERGAQVLVAHQERHLVELLAYARQRAGACCRVPLSGFKSEEDFMITSHSRQTSGTTRRAARQMSGRGHVFELTDEVRSLRGELDHTSGGRAATGQD
jgi:hypothetical protein